ncbi:dUTP diphosphatase [Paenibacillus naphthalenovorans]|uniref:dUTP diphosphatase n=1 Tax=Paenibacillus naphthalenovorans TaxID=162209 RepID=UPI00088624CC|nr:dUTP diphosphatase [Paenibacillus naphthalenovorans]SDJ61464.1 Dimeric dUTPase, all-alpha-NTP-PPase (MazG) superfamily [Paenibacillus naphthalenovorans]
MNLTKLFQIQKELDEPYSHVEDRLSKDILWLQTELGELANEWRGFRYRRPESEQKPRMEAWSETGIIITDCNPLLEEYTDCLSIILSIGLEIERDNVLVNFPTIGEQNNKRIIIERFDMVFRMASMMNDDDYYRELFNYFLDLGFMLGFTWEQIESNYIEKSKLNKERNVIV